MDWNWENTALMGAGTKKAPILRACRQDPCCSYYLYLPKGFTGENAANYRLAVVVHGTTRDAERLKNEFTDFADATGTAILAPLFPCGIIDRQDIHNYKFIKFHHMRFDLLLLDMVDEVTGTFGINGDQFFLHGFSGGGQFVHRMYYLHPERLLCVSIGAPGRSTYLEDQKWYDGVGDFEEQFGKKLDYEGLKAVPVLLIIGDEDTEVVNYSGDLTNSESLQSHGSNRLERMESLYENYLDHGINVRMEKVPGVAHEGMKVLPSVKAFFTRVLDEL